MRNFLLAIFLSVITASQLRGESEHEFFAHFIDALPKASPGEFKTPESVARFFVQGIIDSHIQDTFRCFPLSRMFAVDTFENSVRYVGNSYDPRKDTSPDDDYGRYVKLLVQFHYQPIQRCRLELMHAINPSMTNLIEGRQYTEAKDPVAVNQWLQKLSQGLSFQTLTNAAIASATSEPRKNADLKYLGVLPFKDIHVVTMHVSAGGSDISIIFMVGLIDDNYQIQGVLF